MRIDNSRIFVADSYILQSQEYYKKAKEGVLTDKDIKYIKAKAQPLSLNCVYIKFGEGYVIFNRVKSIGEYYKMLKKEKVGIDYVADEVSTTTPQAFMPGFVTYVENIKQLTNKLGSTPARKLYWLNYHKNAVAEGDKRLKLDDFVKNVDKREFLRDSEIKLNDTTYPLDKSHVMLSNVYWVISGRVKDGDVNFRATPYSVTLSDNKRNEIYKFNDGYVNSYDKKVRVADIVNEFNRFSDKGKFIEILNSENVIKKYILNHDNYIKRDIFEYLNLNEYISDTIINTERAEEYSRVISDGVKLNYKQFITNCEKTL